MKFEFFTTDDGVKLGYVDQGSGTADADWRETLKKTDVPVLFFAGEESPFWPGEHAAVSAALCPKGEAAVVAEAGHAVNWECPKEFSALMLDFLSRVSKSH